MVFSSGPRTASTMQNSDAPMAAVSRAAAMSSSRSRNGVAWTTVSNCADCEQKWQSSGQPPVLAERMPSTSTSGPHHARRTSWASAARAGTLASGSAARAASSPVGELAALGEERLACLVDEGPSVGHGWDVRTRPVSGSNP